MAAFRPETLQAIARDREVRFQTTGHRTGKPDTVTVWVSTDDERVFIPSPSW